MYLLSFYKQSKVCDKIAISFYLLFFSDQFWRMQRSGDYYVTVIEDGRSNRIIGSSTLITECKFIHECGLRGRLEDVVVNNTYRGKQLGKL